MFFYYVILSRNRDVLLIIRFFLNGLVQVLINNGYNCNMFGVDFMQIAQDNNNAE